jgi:hypothetical protein
MLEEEAEKRGKTPPPPPLTHGLDHDPTEEEKVERLREQLNWADRNTLLHQIQMFFEAMPPRPGRNCPPESNGRGQTPGDKL